MTTTYIYKKSKKIQNKLQKLNSNFEIISGFLKIKKKSTIFINLKEFVKIEDNIARTLIKDKCKIVIVTSRRDKLKDKETAYNKGITVFISKKISLIEFKLFLKLLNNSNKKTLVIPNTIIDKIPIPVFIKNTESKFIDCNEAFCKYMGAEKKEILGKETSDFTTNKKAQIYEAADIKVLKTEQEITHYGKIINTKNITQNTIITKSVFKDLHGNTLGIIGTVTDITQQKNKEKEIKKDRQKAKTADKLKTSFLSNMSHEIRTPMNAIVGFSQLLATPNIPTEKRKIYIEQINSNSAQLLKLIEDIIEISKIEAGKVKMTKNHCYVNQILDELKISFETHKARQGKNHVQLIVKKAVSNTKFNFISDPYRLNQIITNLLGNAVKFTDEGEIIFGYKIIHENKIIEFFVEDTGIGINDEKMQYIFDRFSKIPANKTKLYGGTGIGLSISKSLTELLGGEIFVESEEDIGTKFYFRLPFIEEDENVKTEPIINEVISENEYLWQDKTILIAEDEEMNYLYLQEVLSDTKAKIIWMKNGKDAVKEAITNNDISLILMDLKMPQMDGNEATKKIKEIKPNIPIIIQSAYALGDKELPKENVYYDCYLEKPVKYLELLETIAKFI